MTRLGAVRHRRGAPSRVPSNSEGRAAVRRATGFDAFAAIALRPYGAELERELVELGVGQLLDVNHFIVRLVNGPDKFIQLQVDGSNPRADPCG